MSRLPVTPRSRDEIIEDYPIESSVPGWFFRYAEVSNNVYLVEGCDRWGRKVTRTGSDEKALLSDCEADARAINDQINPTF